MSKFERLDRTMNVIRAILQITVGFLILLSVFAEKEQEE